MNALRQVPVMVTLAVRNAISAAKSVTSLATALRVVTSATDTAAMAGGSRPAIPAVASATWLAIAPRAKSATTVSMIHLSVVSKLSSPSIRRRGWTCLP